MRSLSDNIIKWNYVHFDRDEKHKIEPKPAKKGGDTLASSKYGQELLKQLHIASPQDLVDQMADPGKKEFIPENFHEGISIVNYDQVMEEEKKRIAEEANSLLSDAKKQAKEILDEAGQQAEAIKQSAYEEGKQAGLDEAAAEAEQKAGEAEAALEERRRALEEDYQEKQKEMEPHFVELICALIEKITGVVVSDRKDVILHLITQGIEESGKSGRFLIHVSTQDLAFVESQKVYLESELPLEASLDFIEDVTLGKNQCLIETDTKVVDSSLDLQLRNLLEDLKLLSVSV